ncbi:MAG: hypothetical protein V4641_16260 [Pseudomonadota bacterium]
MAIDIPSMPIVAPERSLRQDVMNIFAWAGFEVRDTDNIFAINGSIDSAAILIEMLLTGELPGEGEEDAN